MRNLAVLKPAARSAHRIKRITVVTVCVSVLAAVQGSCASTKQLTEASGRELIREYIRSQKQGFTVPLAAIVPLMSRTTQDYTATTSANGVEVILKRLIERKLVAQSPVTIAYPVISGQFSRRELDSHQQALFTLDHRDHWSVETYTLEMTPNSTAVTGKLDIVYDPLYKKEDIPYGFTWGNDLLHQSVTGTVYPDGSVDLQSSNENPVLNRRGRFVYGEEGAVAYLRYPNGTKLIGKAAGHKVELREYDYSFSPEMQRRVVGQGQQAYVSAGTIEVGTVSGLRLDSETAARAEFIWHAEMNDAGHALLGDDAKPVGKGGVTFAKKPDGTWFVDRVWYQ